MFGTGAAQLGFPTIAEIYDRYAALAKPAGLGGTLLLYSGLDADGIAVAVASNIAGAASLGIEANAEQAKAALRVGVCNFVVNNLDEALRILKNEIRKNTSVSVVLTAKLQVTVEEIVKRGVQPNIVAFSEPMLEERGARRLAVTTLGEPVQVTWSVEREGPQWLPLIDKLAVSSLSKPNARTRWIESAPRYLGRSYAGQRYVRMAESETDAFVAAVRTAVQSGAVPGPVLVELDSEPVRIEAV